MHDTIFTTTHCDLSLVSSIKTTTTSDYLRHGASETANRIHYVQVRTNMIRGRAQTSTFAQGLILHKFLVTQTLPSGLLADVWNIQQMLFYQRMQF